MQLNIYNFKNIFDIRAFREILAEWKPFLGVVLYCGFESKNHSFPKLKINIKIVYQASLPNLLEFEVLCTVYKL